MSKLTINNFKYIIFNSDTLALRALLVFASVQWALWTLFVTHPMWVDHTEPGFNDMFLGYWAVAFLIYGCWSSFLLLTKDPRRSVNIVCSALGTIAWSSTVVMLVLVRIRTGVLPLGGLHVTTSVAMWWVFLKDCFSPYTVE